MAILFYNNQFYNVRVCIILLNMKTKKEIKTNVILAISQKNVLRHNVIYHNINIIWSYCPALCSMRHALMNVRAFYVRTIQNWEICTSCTSAKNLHDAGNNAINVIFFKNVQLSIVCTWLYEC